MKPGLKHKQVTVLQLELRMNGLLVGSTTGILDARTISAFANFQRSIGYVGSEVTGIPDKQSLNRLAQIRQTFNVTD
jgi:peptidoglycan hydrolase-like protein with peptidoglycan-binding domain